LSCTSAANGPNFDIYGTLSWRVEKMDQTRTNLIPQTEIASSRKYPRDAAKPRRRRRPCGRHWTPGLTARQSPGDPMRRHSQRERRRSPVPCDLARGAGGSHHRFHLRRTLTAVASTTTPQRDRPDRRRDEAGRSRRSTCARAVPGGPRAAWSSWLSAASWCVCADGSMPTRCGGCSTCWRRAHDPGVGEDLRLLHAAARHSVQG
jgi:hypothetical protein